MIDAFEYPREGIASAQLASSEQQTSPKAKEDLEKRKRSMIADALKEAEKVPEKKVKKK